MAIAKKLPSGSYRVQQYIGKDASGKRIYKSFTASTKKEAEFLASEYAHFNKQTSEITLKRAMEQYIELHTTTHSPATIREYRKLVSRAYDDILDMPIYKLNETVMSRWVNVYGASRNPKTVRNAYSLIKASCKMQGYNIPHVILPKISQIDYKIPTDNEIKRIIEEFRQRGDQEMVFATMLGAYGMMRLGEICALRQSDFSKQDGMDVVHISKSMAQDSNNNWIVKTPKNYTSDRYVSLPPFVIAEKPKSDPIFSMHNKAMANRFYKCCKKLGMKEYHFHLLRHYGTSVLAANNVPDVLLQRIGGWSSDKVLKNVYRNAMPEYMREAQKKTMSIFENLQ